NYGVTTVVICDCGAACAPVPPKGPSRDILMTYLHRVLDKYVDDSQFEWTTYEDYLNYLEGRVGINVGAFVPHSPIRLAVMGEDAGKRTATPDEVAAMVEHVEAGWRAGAIGFSSSPLGGPHAQGRPAYGVVVPYQHIQNMRAANFAPLQGIVAWEDLPKEPEALRERLADPALRETLRAAAAERGTRCLWDELLVKRTA